MEASRLEQTASPEPSAENATGFDARMQSGEFYAAYRLAMTAQDKDHMSLALSKSFERSMLRRDYYQALVAAVKWRAFDSAASQAAVDIAWDAYYQALPAYQKVTKEKNYEIDAIANMWRPLETVDHSSH